MKSLHENTKMFFSEKIVGQQNVRPSDDSYISLRITPLSKYIMHAKSEGAVPWDKQSFPVENGVLEELIVGA